MGEAESYREKHKFDIEGEGLTAEEVAEQKRNLINKIFTIGYMLHRYKSPSRAWAPQAMDNKIGEDGECNGRFGQIIHVQGSFLLYEDRQAFRP